MKRRVILIVFLAMLQIPSMIAIIDPLSIGIASVGAGLLTGGYQMYLKCRIYECCNDNYISIDVGELERQLITRLHGQHIARKTIIGAISGYRSTADPPKALVMSFHGSQGTGKNFVARLIAETFYKEGMKSKFFHFFSGRTEYPVTSRLEEYKERLSKTIVESLMECEKSMFVFDEVDKMPEGLLNVLVPFLDYVKVTAVEHNSKRVRLTTNKAIYIFLSNTGMVPIMNQMVNFWTEGRNRNEMSLSDFENLIAKGAFNEKGGFLKCDTIRSSLIDHYVPFLPLEEEHVKLCMKDALKKRKVQSITQEMEETIMSVVSYGPKPYNIYAESGCKRIEQKVITTVPAEQQLINAV